MTVIPTTREPTITAAVIALSDFPDHIVPPHIAHIAEISIGMIDMEDGTRKTNENIYAATRKKTTATTLFIILVSFELRANE